MTTANIIPAPKTVAEITLISELEIEVHKYGESSKSKHNADARKLNAQSFFCVN